ncbi:lactococcin 972 family bacteriocin [Streptomyces sp. NPDC093094]|uniref:lactococcin 972 family bacteriocin n=1 Tax=Streptomyces sp. NPDC093094 TaxID=3366026 RepID=UPI0037F2746F
MAGFMKNLGRPFALAVMSTVLAVGALTAPAGAAASDPGPSAPDFLGNPREWGMVAIDADPAGRTAAPLDVVQVGGGTWSYGTEVDGLLKGCHSHYTHPSLYHSAMAITGDASDRQYADAGAWAKARGSAGFGFTCYVYWATY